MTTPPSAPHPDPATDAWQRVHPLTPVLRSWRTVATVLALVTLRSESAIRDLFSRLAHASDGSETSGLHLDTSRLPLVVAVLLTALALLLGLNWVGWRATSFRVTPTAVEVRRGVLRTEHRQARLDRVQAVDLVQPFVPRLFGLAQISFDVAGARHAQLQIGYLTRAHAESLRTDLLVAVRARREQVHRPVIDESATQTDVQVTDAVPTQNETQVRGRASTTHRAGVEHSRPRTVGGRIMQTLSAEAVAVGADLGSTLSSTFAAYAARTPTEQTAPSDPTNPAHSVDAVRRIVHVPPHRVVLASLLTPGALFAMAWLIFGIGVLITGVVTGNAGTGWAIAFTTFLTAAGFLHTSLQSALKQGNFSAALTPEGLLITQGITSTEHRLVPLDRIQAVGVVQPLLWRPFGWWRAHYNIASGGLGEAVGESHALLPVGRAADAWAMLELALPLLPSGDRDPELDEPRLQDAMSAHPHGLHAQAPASRWLDPLGRPVNGWHRTATTTIIRHGRIRRRVACIPHARLQSMSVHRGPLQRMLGLATLHLHSTSGPVGGAIRHQHEYDARRLLFEFADITRDARHAEKALTPARHRGERAGQG